MAARPRRPSDDRPRFTPSTARPWSYPVLVWTNRYLAGESTTRIAVDAGVSASTVNTYLSRAGVPLRGRKEREA